ncbi:MAG: tetratricopeptide repeat protein [Pseudomonadota bacterium]
MIRILLSTALLACPAVAFANAEAPTRQTPTSQSCADGKIWNAATKTCVDAQDSRFRDSDRLDAARELAVAGRDAAAALVLSALAAPDNPDALATRGFAARKAGAVTQGVALYERALAQAPDHWMTLGYYGQHLAEIGDLEGAETLLMRIRASGGRGTWPEIALTRALAGDTVY